jgi:hydrogenase/urease accessory protein HupE
LALALLALLPIEDVSAHPPFAGATGFYGGLLHPLFVPAHALAVLGLGLLSGQAPRWRWPMALAYAAGLGAGFAAMISAFAPQSGEVLLAAAAIVGMSVASARTVSAPIGCGLALVIGTTLALDSPPGGISVRQANVIVLGTFSGALILLWAVQKVAAMLRREWQLLGVRILGAWVAASAILILTWKFAR